MPLIAQPWACEEHRACCIVKKRAGRLTGHHAEEPAAAPTAEGEERGVVIDADMSQDGLGVAPYDLRRRVRSGAHHLGRRRAGTVGFLFELCHDVAQLEACVYRDAGIDSCDGSDAPTGRTQRQRLSKGFEAEVGPIDTHHHSIEQAHGLIIATAVRDANQGGH